MRDKYLVFGAPEITSADIKKVISALESGWIGTGPQTAILEETFCDYKKVPFGAALSSCTAALHLSMIALGVKAGDEVITSPMTFCATANAIVHTGARPVFADIDPLTGLIDPKDIIKRITPRTKAILPIHLCGRPCPMDDIMDIANEHNLQIIEDCAHAIETTYHGRHAGSFGAGGCFSFYVTKNITSIEGGMLITHNKELADKVKTLALHGMTADAWQRFSDKGYKHYEVAQPGYKNNLSDVQSALALSQMERIKDNLKRREIIWSKYDDAFGGLPCLIPPTGEENTRHARHLYTLLLKLEELSITRDQFLEELHDRNIGAGVHYRSLHLHKYYREKFNYQADDFPHSLWHSDRTVSLPLSPALSEQDISDVINAVTDILKRFKQ